MHAALWKQFEHQWIDNTYELQSLIGVGGFGGVFRAEHKIEKVSLRQVAVKLILPDEASFQRQLAELVVSTTLHHDNLVSSYHAGVTVLNGVKVLYMVMELGEET